MYVCMYVHTFFDVDRNSLLHVYTNFLTFASFSPNHLHSTWPTQGEILPDVCMLCPDRICILLPHVFFGDVG